MKKLIVLALLIAGQVAAWGQTVNVHMKDGSVIKYDASGVDYVNFSAASSSGLNGHEAVDLGLPSGLKWATCNIGASTPEEAGYFFAWGEVAEKDTYDWSTYKWSVNGSSSNFSKYTSKGGTLEPADDAAQVLWGGSWRMPTQAEAQELLDNCKKAMVTQNNKNGLRLTGPNGNTIFLPASGYYDKNAISGEIYDGYYWLSDLDSYARPYNLYVHWRNLQKAQGIGIDSRYYGFTIRAVTAE